MNTHSPDIQRMLEKILHKVIKYDRDGMTAIRKAEPYNFVDVLVIREIGLKENIAIHQLMDRLKLDRGIVATSLSRLSGRGLLHKSKDPADKRKSFIALTPEGQEFFGRLNQMEVDYLDLILKDMTINEQKAVLKFLSRVNQMTVGKFEVEAGE